MFKGDVDPVNESHDVTIVLVTKVIIMINNDGHDDHDR